MHAEYLLGRLSLLLLAFFHFTDVWKPSIFLECKIVQTMFRNRFLLLLLSTFVREWWWWWQVQSSELKKCTQTDTRMPCMLFASSVVGRKRKEQSSVSGTACKYAGWRGRMTDNGFQLPTMRVVVVAWRVWSRASDQIDVFSRFFSYLFFVLKL